MAELSELPPPRRGAKPGYYPDPLGSGRGRWWDGANWSHMLGPLAPAAAAGKPLAPPTKVCRHCGAQAQTFESSCPSCGRGYARNTAVIIGIVAACIGMIVLIGGCFALLAAVVDDVDDQAITREEFESVQIGDSRAGVEARLGRPADTSQIEDPRGRFACLLYDDADQRLEDREYFELCFLRGRLFSKRDFD